MNIRSYDEPREPELYLRLLNRSPDRVSLCAVDEDGHAVPNGALLAVTANGFLPIGAVDPSLGLPLDEDGCVQLVDGPSDTRLKELLRLIEPFVEYIKRRDALAGPPLDDDHLVLKAFRVITVDHFRALAKFYDEEST